MYLTGKFHLMMSGYVGQYLSFPMAIEYMYMYKSNHDNHGQVNTITRPAWNHRTMGDEKPLLSPALKIKCNYNFKEAWYN